MKMMTRRLFGLLAGLPVFLLAVTAQGDEAIKPEFVEAIGVYGRAADFGRNRQPDQLVFDIQTADDINAIVSSIDFDDERDCSTVGAHTNAYVYLLLKDHTILVYDLFLMYGVIAKQGARDSCYVVGATGGELMRLHER
jgi:hypothetical protein